ncbi:hypothetical protein RTG_01091 [Rhodotorula toruloides ATCC 204091]|uniref:Protein arginine methyltransferase NDUFAF7 n=1 Tax=Rhodotorula toruloides TaxID=5286 RepID=A0A0K3C3Q9_RHOTO|nr:hypothetical protein RTG_01091 [Rhodotorula toruloides ATCC 204091]KAK4334186.1 Protein arginine methyltransferase NDUFAF7 [Rhodotorula toruloides]PRQ77376.1 S-adenosyl-L-methionine-dependent methyltransferase [Rhodotorula toruloides]
MHSTCLIRGVVRSTRTGKGLGTALGSTGAIRTNSSFTRPPAPPPNAPRPSVKSVGETRPDPPKPQSTPSAASTTSTGPDRPAPTELLTVLQETIKTHGPLPVSRYMTLCLNHPTLGYYTTRKVFGKEGDFVTSPEISQVFGELLGIWFVTQWLAQGAPQSVRIVELGPGRGTLLADVLRTFRSLPANSRPPITSIHLVEASEQLQRVQKQKLAETGFGETETRWYGDVKEIPESKDEFTVLIAHEFFDALPIHIFENTQSGWREVLVDIADPKAIVANPSKAEPLRLVLAPNATPASALYTSLAHAIYPSAQRQPDLASAAPAPKSALLNVDTTLGASSAPPAPSGKEGSLIAQRFARLPIGSRLEVSPSSWEIARDLARVVAGPEGGKGGAGLVVDYGDAKAFGRSWRGFRKHQVVDPLTEPGHTDLTANVDFAYLSEAMSEFAETPGPLSQRAFLTALGLEPRLASLLRNASSEERQSEIASAAKRLVDKAGMGEQYKFLAVVPKGKQQAEGVYPFNVK